MDVIGRPQSPLQLYYSCLSSPLNNRCIPLIDNLVSFPLIFKDVRLYNEVKSRMFHFVLSFFLNVKTSLGNGCSFAIQFMKGLMSSTAAEESECWSCSMSPHKSSGKQSHPVILLRVVLLSMKNNRIHLRSHTCSSCIFLSSHYIFLWFCSSCSFFFSLSSTFLFRSPGLFQSAAMQRRWRVLSRHVHLQQQHCGLQREGSHRHPSESA